MNGVKLSALTAAITLSISGVAQADKLADENARDAGFLAGSSLDMKLRNAYFDRDYKRGADDSDTWGQSIELNYQSGYIADIIGFDASYYGGIPLDGDLKNGNPGLLPNDSDGDLDNYSKLAQAYLKAKLGDENLGAYGEFGRMKIDNVLVASSSSRLTPSTFQGGLIDFYLHGAKLQYIQLDKMSKRNESSFNDFEGKNGNIDKVQSFGAWYSFAEGTNLGAEYVLSEDYLKIGYLNANHSFALGENTNLLIDGQYYWAKEDGNLWSGSKDSKGRDYDAKIYNLNAQLDHNAWTLKAAYTYSDIDGKVDGSDGGVFWYQIADNDHGGGNMWTMAGVSDFAYDGEKAYMVGAAYDFADHGLPGLSAGANFFYGNDINYAGKSNLSEQETDFFVEYAFQNESLKGLSVAWEHYNYRGDRELDFYASKGRLKEHRIYIDYTIALM